LTEEWYEDPDQDGAWRFEPYDRKRICEARNLVQQHYSPELDGVAPYEGVLIEGAGEHTPEDFDHLLIVMLADIIVAPDKTGPWDAVATCPACKNTYVDPGFKGAYTERKMPKKKAWFSLRGDLKLFARSPFIEDYKDLGLTGLDFTECGNGLFRVNVECHRWTDPSGVCEHCGMKTNVVSTSCFNLEEDYRYDFQFLRMNPGERQNHVLFVVTPAAMSLVRKYATAAGEMKYCLSGIVPGMMKDLIWPQDKLYTNGEIPETVFRDPLCK